MDKAKEIIADPAKLEAELKKAWEKLDPEKKGYATYDVVEKCLREQAKALGIPERLLNRHRKMHESELSVGEMTLKDILKELEKLLMKTL